MAQRTDVAMQAYLDSLSQVPGSILIRGRREWRALPPGPPNSVLAWTDENDLHWSTEFGGGGTSGPVTTNSHDFTSPGEVYNNDETFGSLWEIGPDDITAYSLQYYGASSPGWFLLGIYEDGNETPLRLAAVVPEVDTWVTAPIKPLVLTAGTRYVFQHRNFSWGRYDMYRNPPEFTTQPELSFVEGRMDFGQDYAYWPISAQHLAVRIGFTKP